MLCWIVLNGLIEVSGAAMQLICAVSICNGDVRRQRLCEVYLVINICITLHSPYPVYYIRHWNEIMEWNWGEKRMGRWQDSAYVQQPQCLPEKPREKKRGCGTYSAEWWSLLKCSCCLGAGIPLIVFCVFGDLADTLQIIVGSIQAPQGLLWDGTAACAIQGWLDHGPTND